MSAWLVNKEHIDVLVTAGIALKLIDQADANTIGDQMWQENARSLRHRYEDAPTFWDLPDPGSYRFQPRPIEDLYYIYKQTCCYSYQACEHPEWDDSESFRLAESIERRIEEVLGSNHAAILDHPQTEKATWGAEVKDDDSLWLDQDEYRAWVLNARASA